MKSAARGTQAEEQGRILHFSLYESKILAATLGGVVIFKVVQTESGFEVNEIGSFLMAAEEQPISEPSEDTLEFQDTVSSSPQIENVAMDASAVETLSNVAAFQMHAKASTPNHGLCDLGFHVSKLHRSRRCHQLWEKIESGRFLWSSADRAASKEGTPEYPPHADGGLGWRSEPLRD